MPHANADRNLLFGILALQLNFITRDQLVTAMQAWVNDKGKSLGAILLDQKALAEDTRALLEALVQKHLAQHQNDPSKSLAALSSFDAIKQELKHVTDPEVQASLGQSADSQPDDTDPYATRGEPSDHAAGLYASSAPFAHTAPNPGLRFRILRPHARGGLGEVHVARDEELGREVALKQIQDRHADDRDSQARFMLEAEITGGLEHPGIVPVYGLGHYADGRPFYAMRFIRGDSLKDACERFHKADAADRDPGERSLELRSLLGRFVDVCNAIAYAHSRGVLHRDLKPGNIMLGKYGETLVVDWGLAKTVDGPAIVSTEPGEGSLTPSSASMASHTMMGSAMGTPQFMSPEQAAGRLDLLGPPSDVYSLGATLYFLLTGKPPINDKEVGSTLQKVQRGEFPPPRQIKADIHPALEAICMKAMALKPYDRYGSPRTMAEDIEHWLADEPVSAWREPWTVKARRWVSRHGMLVTGCVTGVVVAAIGLTLATILLTRAYDAERIAKDLATKQKVIAENNYRLARQAVDRYHTEVSESVLLHEPGMQPLRKNLLVAAKDFYEKFVAARSGEPDVQGELGLATYRLALITDDIDSKTKAIDLLQQAKTIFVGLVKTEPNDKDWQSDLASSWHHLGRLYRQTNDYKKGEDAYVQALVLWTPLAASDPKEDRYRAEQARSQLGLGSIYQVSQRLDKSRELYEKALKTRTKLAEDNPKTPSYQRDLAISYVDLARVYSALGLEEEKAEKAFLAAIAIQKKLSADFPYISQYQNDLGLSLHNLGDLYFKSEQKKRAETPFQDAATVWEKLADKHPAMTDYRIKLAETYSDLALMYKESKLAFKAEEAVAKAIAIKKKIAADELENTRYQNNLALGLKDQGDIAREFGQGPEAEAAYQEASRMLEKLVAALPEVPDTQADLARTYNNLGLLFAGQSQNDKAEAAYKKAMLLWEKLESDYPEVLVYKAGLSKTAYNLGDLQRNHGNPRGGLDWYARALKPFESLSADQRKEASIITEMRNLHWKRAEAWTQLGSFTEALPDWNRALELAAGSKTRDYFQLYHARGLARAGDYIAAVKEADALLEKATKVKSGEPLFQLACVYALSMAAAANDNKLPADTRQVLGDQYALRGLESLKTAQNVGFFLMLPNLERLRKEAELAPLRVREEFRQLLNEVEEKAKTAS